jgi:chitinase
MDISKMSSLGYTHVHFAFANITSSFQVDVSGVQSQFNGLKQLTGIKRIISFGGWAFSTSPDSAPIFRQGVTAAQRTTFINNVVSFINNNNLDGVDFDWEYPGVCFLSSIYILYYLDLCVANVQF